MHIYTLLFDTESFKKLMRFIIVSYSLTMLICILFPNCQELRPVAFERDNIFTRFLAGFYQFDTNTNVCPSIHVSSTSAIHWVIWKSPLLRDRPWVRWGSGVLTLLICLSTVFLKQHSVVDVLCGLLLTGLLVPLEPLFARLLPKRLLAVRQ